MFIVSGNETTVDLEQTPFLCNVAGLPHYYAQPPAGLKLLEAAALDPEIELGNAYKVRPDPTTSPDPQYGDRTRLEFQGSQVEYTALRASREVAAAFGMTLVKPGQGVRISSPHPVLKQIDYEYGMFAGHRSPYEGTGFRMLGKVCTDLEYHNFPHVFASVDAHLPRVITVAKYWPYQKKICLADLWLARGHALYLPPQPEPPPLSQSDTTCLSLHGDRNVALACWHDSGLKQASIKAQTLLQTEGGRFHWLWNELPTVHPQLPLSSLTKAPHA